MAGHCATPAVARRSVRPPPPPAAGGALLCWPRVGAVPAGEWWWGQSPPASQRSPGFVTLKCTFGVVGQMKENSSGPGVWLTGTRHLHRPRPLQHHEAWSRPSEARGLQPGRAQDGVEGQREQLRAGSTRPGWEPRASIPPAAREYRGLPRLGAPRFLVHGPYPPPKPAELSGEQAQTP